MQEEWKDIIGYEGYYKISNLGNVKFLERKITTSQSERIYKEKINKIWLSKRGYSVTDLIVNKLRKTKTIHRLTAIHFINNPLNKPFVNHIDGNKSNNSIQNLEWVNNMENMCHAKKNVKRSSQYIGVGWDKWANKWKSQIYHNGRSIHLGNFFTEQEAYSARVKYEQENNVQNKYL
jgi:hypothetical protein